MSGEMPTPPEVAEGAKNPWDMNDDEFESALKAEGNLSEEFKGQIREARKKELPAMTGIRNVEKKLEEESQESAKKWKEFKVKDNKEMFIKDIEPAINFMQGAFKDLEMKQIFDQIKTKMRNETDFLRQQENIKMFVDFFRDPEILDMVKSGKELLESTAKDFEKLLEIDFHKTIK